MKPHLFNSQGKILSKMSKNTMLSLLQCNLQSMALYCTQCVSMNKGNEGQTTPAKGQGHGQSSQEDQGGRPQGAPYLLIHNGLFPKLLLTFSADTHSQNHNPAKSALRQRSSLSAIQEYVSLSPCILQCNTGDVIMLERRGSVGRSSDTIQRDPSEQPSGFFSILWGYSSKSISVVYLFIFFNMSLLYFSF